MNWLSAGLTCTTRSCQTSLVTTNPACCSGLAAGTSLGNLNGVFVTQVPIPGLFVPGIGGAVANLDVRQRNVVPDIVGAFRYDAPWGAAQISAAVHEISTGKYDGSYSIVGFNAAGAYTLNGIGAVTGAALPSTRTSAQPASRLSRRFSRSGRS